MTTLRDIGELDAVARLCRQLPGHDDLVVGAGDDCAVVRIGDSATEEWVLTSDAVIEGVHFTHEARPEAAGHKAVGRVLSDLAAMGAEPRWALIDVVGTPDTSAAVLEGWYAGAMKLAGAHGLTVVGGDVAEGRCCEMHVFAMGTVPAGRALLRSTAGAGDALFVTGTLGGSLQGRHLEIEPRVRAGIWLRDWATSMIDLSDGLATDLRHLTTASGRGCELRCDAIPVSEDAAAMGDGRSSLEHALRDGEDFELLFTVAADRAEALASAWAGRFELPCTRIGTMTEEGEGIRCAFEDGRSAPLDATGYTHFESGGGR